MWISRRKNLPQAAGFQEASPADLKKSKFSRWRWIGLVIEPHFLLPAATVVMLSVIWGSASQLIQVERANAQQSAAALTLNLADVYEVQVLRALREIDQTLKFVKYAYESRGDTSVLADLKTRDILPTGRVFIVSISDRSGTVIASTHPKTATSLSSDNFFQRAPNNDAVLVSPPHRNLTGEWTVDFSRRMQTADGAFAGIAWVTVSADYFVSGYEKERLGERGVLGLVGTEDGIFRVRRSGDTITAGASIDYTAIASKAGDVVEASTSSLDHVRRYTSVHPLYGYPLAVVVGISESDQLAAVQKSVDFYTRRAAAASVALGVVMLLLWMLLQSRKRAVEERLAHAERVEYLAYHDGLTGLPNRRLLSKLQNQAIAQASRYNHTASIFFLDLDGFKQINDTLGHDAGDLLLQEVARRLKNCLRQSDTVARLGGDEFVVLLPETDGEAYVVTVAQKILTAIAKPYTLTGQEFRVTASIGISVFPNDGLDEQTLAKNADIAMYRAKEQGKNNIQFFSVATSKELPRLLGT